MRKRSFLFLVAPILALVLVGVLLYSMRSAQPSPAVAAAALPAEAASTPAALAPATSAPAAGAPTALRAPTATPAQAVTSAATEDGNLVAVVAGERLLLDRFALVQAVDSAMSALLATAPATPQQLLEQMVNHALVVQQMAAAGPSPAVDSAAPLAALLGASGKTQSELAAALAANGVERDVFDRYFAELLAVDEFVGEAAQTTGGDIDAYIARLQTGVHISFGPAAARLATAPTGAPQVTGASVTAIVTDAGTDAGTGSSVVADTFIVKATDAVTATASIADTPTTRGLQPGQLAPDFALPALDIDQGEFVFADLLGKPTVLGFWTTWCPYCLRQTPVLVAAVQRHAGDVRFVGIDVAEAANTVATYVEEHQIPYSVLLDTAGDTAATYGVDGYPTTYFLDAAGHIVARHIGALTEDQLNQYVEQLLAPRS